MDVCDAQRCLQDEDVAFFDSLVAALNRLLDKLDSPRAICFGRGGKRNSGQNLVYGAYLLTVSFFYKQFLTLPADGGYKKLLAARVTALLHQRLSFIFRDQHETLPWHDHRVIDKVGKRIQEQRPVAFSIDRLYKCVETSIADEVCRMIQTLKLPIKKIPFELPVRIPCVMTPTHSHQIYQAQLALLRDHSPLASKKTGNITKIISPTIDDDVTIQTEVEDDDIPRDFLASRLIFDH